MSDFLVFHNGIQHGQNVPIKAWVNGVQMEPEALDQLENVASLPFIHKHVAVMPDVHAGYGATVGSVIPTVGAIIPAAVGVDIGCLDRETEYLTPSGWMKFNSYDDEEVLQYDPITHTASFIKPLAYIRRPVTEMYHLKHSKGLDQVICDRHKILFYRGYGKEVGSREYSIHISEDFVKHHKTLNKGLAGGFLTVFTIRNTSSTDLTDEELRVQVMVSADGSLRAGGYCEAHFSKIRKIDRAKDILAAAGIEFRKYDHEDGTVTLRFDPPISDKSLSFVYGCSQLQLNIVRDEIFRWDGTIAADGQEIFSTTVRENADAVQYVLAACGIRAGISVIEHQDKKWNTNYQVYTTKNPFVNMAPDSAHSVEKIPSADGLAYCFTVPSGFLVARRNNNIFVTGNCGMAAIRTGLTASHLPDNLKPWRSAIEKAVPHGFGKGASHVQGGFNVHNIPTDTVNVWKGALERKYEEIISKHPSVQGNNTINHLGTLGSGNHFIELCLDEKDRVWLMLHSGSRGVGNRIGSYFTELAKEDMRLFFINLPDKDLAYFPEGTEHFDDYIDAMSWAQDFARYNRELMVRQIFDALRQLKGVSQGKLMAHEIAVNCHHNYTTRENHFGRNVWLTRKGAVCARKGVLGIIPGSMGARSYIVEGKGNPESFNSCSHGAGRAMSRSKARKTFSLDDHIAATKGVECRKDLDVIDETPAAYKDIDAVMAAQDSLVSIKHTLKQVLCVKG